MLCVFLFPGGARPEPERHRELEGEEVRELLQAVSVEDGQELGLHQPHRGHGGGLQRFWHIYFLKNRENRTGLFGIGGIPFKLFFLLKNR